MDSSVIYDLIEQGWKLVQYREVNNDPPNVWLINPNDDTSNPIKIPYVCNILTYTPFDIEIDGNLHEQLINIRYTERAHVREYEDRTIFMPTAELFEWLGNDYDPHHGYNTVSDTIKIFECKPDKINTWGGRFSTTWAYYEKWNGPDPKADIFKNFIHEFDYLPARYMNPNKKYVYYEKYYSNMGTSRRMHPRYSNDFILEDARGDFIDFVVAKVIKTSTMINNYFKPRYCSIEQVGDKWLISPRSMMKKAPYFFLKMNNLFRALINNDREAVEEYINPMEILKSEILTEYLVKLKDDLPIHMIFEHGTMERAKILAPYVYRFKIEGYPNVIHLNTVDRVKPENHREWGGGSNSDDYKYDRLLKKVHDDHVTLTNLPKDRLDLLDNRVANALKNEHWNEYTEKYFIKQEYVPPNFVPVFNKYKLTEKQLVNKPDIFSIHEVNIEELVILSHNQIPVDLRTPWCSQSNAIEVMTHPEISRDIKRVFEQFVPEEYHLAIKSALS